MTASDALTDAIRDEIAALLDDYASAGARVIADRDHWRSMYRAVWHVACGYLDEIDRQRRMLAELREERERVARSVFCE